MTDTQAAQAPYRAVWIGRSVSALVVAALLADGAMQLFAPAKIASMMQEPALRWT